MAYVPPQQFGDHHPKIPAAKAYLHSGKFSYVPKGSLGDTDEYTVAFGVALIQWQVNIHYQVAFKSRPGPDVNITGVFDWAVQRQMGIDDAPPAAKPWIFTVAGHMGAWDNGPAYWSAFPLHEQGRAVVQGIGYDTQSIPFNNRQGYERLDQAIREFKPPNTRYAIMAHSQGAIIACDYIEQQVLAHPDDPALAGFRGGVMFGNPRAAVGYTAPWITDPPDKSHGGIAPDRLAKPFPNVEECRRRGDLYSDMELGQAAEYKIAVYRAVAKGELWGGADSLAEQLTEVAINPLGEVWPMFSAIIGATQFAINMDPHNVFDLTPPREHVARILSI
mgnify:CR=1 FL=1